MLRMAIHSHFNNNWLLWSSIFRWLHKPPSLPWFWGGWKKALRRIWSWHLVYQMILVLSGRDRLRSAFRSGPVCRLKERVLRILQFLCMSGDLLSDLLPGFLEVV